MRNYMFDRRMAETPVRRSWPTGRRVAVYTSVYGRYLPARHRRSPLIGFIFFLLLISVLIITALMIQYGGYSLPWPGGDVFSGGNASNDPSWLPEGDGIEERGETTIPQAEIRGGTVLTIQKEGGESLSARQIYEKTLPSVVSIQAYSDEGTSNGSGIIMSANGYVLTNYHIIKGMEFAWVYLLTEEIGYEAQLVGYSDEIDLAVLKVDARNLTPAEFGSSRTLAVGDVTYALGNPMGYLYGSLTEGIVSALGRSITMGDYQVPLIQTSAPLNTGSSGGALLNDRGQVVGITSAKINSANGVVAEGLGLAIPISEVRGSVNSILTNGRVITPRIGILCVVAEVEGTFGILVDSVDDGGPAQKAGVQAGDLITRAEGIPVASVEELKDVFYDTGVGGSVALSILRGEEELTLLVELAGDGET